MKHSNQVPWVTQAAVLQVDYLHLCPNKGLDTTDEQFQKQHNLFLKVYFYVWKYNL